MSDAPFARWCTLLNRVCAFLTAVTTGLFVLVLIAASGLRWFGVPVEAAEEISRFLFVWACFMGASVALRRDKHVRLLFLPSRLSEAAAARLRLVADTLIIFFLAFVVIQGTQVVWTLRFTVMPVSGLAQAALHAAAPVGSFAMLCFVIERMIGLAPAQASEDRE